MINKFNIKIVKTIIYTGLALIAFAANSVLCRMALGMKLIDASSFTIIRLLAAVIVLFLIVFSRNNNEIKARITSKSSWLASLMLFVYASTFSFSYILLETATGALVLFSTVQITMILLSVMSGNRLHAVEWIGVVIAFSGFVYLVLPSITKPSAIGFFLMVIAGIAWGIYTVIGRSSKSPVMDTAYNFFRTIPLVLILLLFTYQTATYSSEGILLAVLSGGIASAMGYVAWYIALTGLSTIQAAVLQLLVPVIAVLGGIVFVSEIVTLRLLASAAMIIGGILLVVLGQYYGLNKKSKRG